MLKVLAVTLLLPLAILNAEDKIWKARVTVEDPDGSKTQSVCPFMANTAARLPIRLQDSRECVVYITPQEATSTDGRPTGIFDRIQYSIVKSTQLTPNSNSYWPVEIFSVTLPVTFGKDIQLLKFREGTVTVRLSGSEDKE